MTKDFPECKFFEGKDSIHCASLVITPNFTSDERQRKSFSQPSDKVPNGTITFVEYKGKTYGITCWHIIEIFRAAEAKCGKGSHSMRTMVNGFYVVIDRFIQPSPDFSQPKLDIAIREVKPEFVSKIGKVPINLENQPNIPDELNHAIAIGFPTDLKYKKMVDELSHQISMPHVSILAELNGGKPFGRFTMFSELEEKPSVLDYSGASGGPIYWSTSEEYGILGIIYESVAGSALTGEKAIHVSGESATPEIIIGWIDEYHRKSS